METYFYIALIALITAFTRFAPFIIFHKRIPKIISALGMILPPSLIAMVLIYSCKDIILNLPSAFSANLYDIVGILFVLIVHSVFRNMLLSIIGGTIFFVILCNVDKIIGIFPMEF